ncbi:undecaprenyl-diphosphatase [Geodermatophilus telluris]|uniref:Undecaprenyl-diphosphatase n=1 Tax=Geodermatophilus telluris TaxID=1190417 RepID=A0A1G6NU71_9ACTN|nr:undecaprenyl-diphosphatase [Geodermatophilus telluris]
MRSRPQRLTTDPVRVALGLVVLGTGVLIARRGQLPVLERDLFRLVNDLPAAVLPAVWVVMQLGNVLAVPVLAVAAALGRRLRAARDLLVSGLAAYVAADLVKALVGRERPGGLPVGAVLHEGPAGGAGFVSGHSAVAAALATAAAPYLTRRGRRVAWTLAWTVAVARVYVGAHLPLDVVGGVALGWAIGSLVHWLAGVPTRQVRPARVEAVLRRFGLPVTGVAPAAVRARSSQPFEAVDADGRRLYVKYLAPDRHERDRLYRWWRVFAVGDVKDADALAPLHHQAEHEAVAALTVERRGVRVPSVLLARGADRDAVVVQEYVVGRPLDELAAGELTPGLLREVWGQVARTHAARVAHRDLVAASVLVDPAGRPWLVDFGNARTGATDDETAVDVAELLASLAAAPGSPAEPAVLVATAVDVLGDAAVAAALPSLTPLALSWETRRRLHDDPARLRAVRTAVHARLDLPDPDRPAFPPAGPAARVLVTAGCAVALAGPVLVAGAGATAGSIGPQGWRWLGGALLLAGAASLARATAVRHAADRRVSVGRALVLTLVARNVGLVRGRDGERRARARLLERAGLLPPDAHAAAVRTALAGLGGSAVVAVTALALAAVDGSVPTWRSPATVLAAAATGAAAWVLTGAGQLAARRAGSDPAPPRVPRPTGPREDRAALFGWAALATALEATVLACALYAAGGRVPVLAVVAGYAALRLLWTALPAAGLPGAPEVLLLLLLGGLGTPVAAACAAVVVTRSLTTWLPAAVGLAIDRRARPHVLPTSP